jgi:predicted secreted protein
MRKLALADAPQQVSVGETVTIELPSVPTAGYEWTVKGQPGLKVHSTGWVQPGGGQVGGSTVQRFELTPARAGSFEVECVYKRSWEDAPEDRRTLRVVARDAGGR